MHEISSTNSVYYVLAFLVPGLVAIFVRAQFITGRLPKHNEARLTYFVISMIYYAITLPGLEVALTSQGTPYFRTFVWFLLIFIGPAILGLVLGLNSQKGWLRQFIQYFGLNPVHTLPTSWDWKFGNMGAQWVLVTLKNGTRFAGYCGSSSFISSDPNERDLYIERIFDLNDDDEWKPRGENGVLITGGEISTIEFWPANHARTQDAQRK